MQITITFCMYWNYTPRAVSLAAQLLEIHRQAIQQLSLIPAKGGCFEVEVNGQLLYSKLQTERHAEAGEVEGLIAAYLDQQA